MPTPKLRLTPSQMIRARMEVDTADQEPQIWGEQAHDATRAQDPKALSEQVTTGLQFQMLDQVFRVDEIHRVVPKWERS